ncbi:MAG: VWA domain-containing protein [Pirellulaceae bacterium]
MRVFLKELQDTQTVERVGVVTFNEGTYLTQDLTSDYKSLMDSLTAITPSGATAIGDGITSGVSVYQNSPNHRPWAARVMIVLTDGQSNTGSDPIVAATAAAAQGMTIHAVSFTTYGSDTTMRQIADIGGGRFEDAADIAALKKSFLEIVRTIPVLLIE